MTAKEYATTLKGKSMYKEYELTDREYFVLIVIDALRICTAEVVAWLAGYTDYSYCRKSLMRLYNNGYVYSPTILLTLQTAPPFMVATMPIRCTATMEVCRYSAAAMRPNRR